jgi:hypothetical protein
MSVSSEVQRTLVKSPPELWAELSNPAALARHLGELGEIRIVRTEPETTVEWEATQATGRVQIKPSGWGTKVILTATREVPQPKPHSTPLSPAESGPTPQAESEPGADQPESPVKGMGSDRDECEPHAEEAWESTGDQLEPTAGEAWGSDGDELEPTAGEAWGPAVDELEPTAGEAWEPAGDELELHGEAGLGPTSGAESEVVVVAGWEPASEAWLEDSLEPEPQPAPESATRADELANSGAQLEPRRSLFARLFSRRRRRKLFGDPPPEATAIAEPAEDPLETIPAAAPADERLGAIPADDPFETSPTAGPGGEPPSYDSYRILQPAGDPLEAIPPTRSTDDPSQAVPILEASREEPSAAKTDKPPRARTEDTADIPGELKTAEELAAEHVTAVLTSVLDRLGAAHHRPFSRA